MKDDQIAANINQLAGAIEQELSTERDVDRNCRLQDAKELLRQAWFMIVQIPCVPNDLITTTVNKGK